MLFEQCDRALLRIDDPYAKRLFQDLQGKRMPLLTFGREQQAMLRAEQIQLFSDRCESTLCFQGERRQAKLPLPGEFSVENLMAAVGMLLQLGLPFAESVDAVCSCQGVPGRTEVCVSSGGITVLRDYAHTPDSLRKVLRTIRKDFATASPPLPSDFPPKILQGQTAGGLWLSGQTRPKQTSVDDTGGLRKCRPCRDDSG